MFLFFIGFFFIVMDLIYFDTYFFKVHSNIVLHLHLGQPKGLFPVGLPVKILKTSLHIFLHSGYMTCPSNSSRFNHPDYIWWTVQPVKFHNVKPSPLSILNNLKRNVRDHVLQICRKTGNIIVLYILVFKFLERNREARSVWTE